MSRYPVLTRKPRLRPISERRSRVTAEQLLWPSDVPAFSVGEVSPDELGLVGALRAALERKLPIVMFIGGHVIKCGLSPILCRLMAKGGITHLAGNGAVLVHDYELSCHGHTSEHVEGGLRDGSFGMWQPFAIFDSLIYEAASKHYGLGECFGEALCKIEEPAAPSVLAEGWRRHVPVTLHSLIGGDVFHSLCHARGAFGHASFTDFRIFAHSVYELQRRGGVFLCVGSAVHGPEVYLKAVSWARNLMHQDGEPGKPVVTAVLDLQAQPPDDVADDDTAPGYYYRPWKALCRCARVTGGRSYYLQGDHRQTVPLLLAAITEPGQNEDDDGSRADT